MITSSANAQVKYARGLARKKERAAHRQFLVEGTRLIEEAERAGIPPALVFFEPEAVDANPRAKELVARLSTRTRAVHPVSAPVLHSLAQTETPPGLLAVYPFPELPLPSSPALLLLLDALHDPGNVGTILRTAWAAGLDAVLLAPGTADVFNPKVVRAAMGAHFFLPMALLSWAEISARLREIPRVYVADARGERVYTEVDWSPPRAVIIGGEAAGPSLEGQRLATARVSIPMPGQADSLNAAVAAGILLFEAVRRSSLPFTSPLL